MMGLLKCALIFCKLLFIGPQRCILPDHLLFEALDVAWIYLRFILLIEQFFFQTDDCLVLGGYVYLEFGEAGEFEVALHVLEL